MAATKNGGGRDLLARRMLQLERVQGATNARLDVGNERLAGMERLLGVVVDEIRGLRGDVHDLITVVRDDREALGDLRRRIGVLEGRAS